MWHVRGRTEIRVFTKTEAKINSCHLPFKTCFPLSISPRLKANYQRKKERKKGRKEERKVLYLDA
jgi:hypothetical protein